MVIAPVGFSGRLITQRPFALLTVSRVQGPRGDVPLTVTEAPTIPLRPLFVETVPTIRPVVSPAAATSKRLASA